MAGDRCLERSGRISISRSCGTTRMLGAAGRNTTSCAGTTRCLPVRGRKLIDAAMRQHQSLKRLHAQPPGMIVAFLTKDLGVDWRLGKASTLPSTRTAFDLAANNGGWQWQSTGCDASPFPHLQLR